MVDFASLLNKPADSIERPKPMPPGTYHGQITNTEFGESAQKRTPYCRVHVNVQSADESIPPDQLTDVKLPRLMRRDFFLTDDAMYRFTEFMQSCGISLEGRLISECVPDLLQQPVLVDVKHRNGTVDGKVEIFSEIDRISGTAGK